MEIRKPWADAQQSLCSFMSHMNTKIWQLQVKYNEKMWVKTRPVNISGNWYEFCGSTLFDKLIFKVWLLTINKQANY